MNVFGLAAFVGGLLLQVLLGRALGLTRRQQLVCVLVAAGGSLLLGIAVILTTLDECVMEARTGMWPWSPRNEFCEDLGSTAARRVAILFVVPPLIVAMGAILWAKVSPVAAFVAFGLSAATVALPGAYVDTLEIYAQEDTPVLHNPYLRVATDTRPARACYAFGIVSGPRSTRITPASERRCVDLERNEASLALTGNYDEGSSEFALEHLGLEMTENGMVPGAESEGLVVERVYRLPGAEARDGSVLIEIYRP